MVRPLPSELQNTARCLPILQLPDDRVRNEILKVTRNDDDELIAVKCKSIESENYTGDNIPPRPSRKLAFPSP